MRDLMCACNAGFYGNGLTCYPCKTCDVNATKSGQKCSAGSAEDTLVCTCNIGYYGNGTECYTCTNNVVSDCACAAGYYGYGTSCSPCKICDRNANQTSSCPAGSGSDTAQCRCNAGYFGAGTLCSPCDVCDAHATTPGTCPAGTLSYKCSCSAGYFGNGTNCTLCPAGTYSNQGRIKFKIPSYMQLISHRHFLPQPIQGSGSHFWSF